MANIPICTEKRRKMMDITIIGTGRMGRAISRLALNGGSSVTLVDRNPEKAARLAEELRNDAKNDARVSAATLDAVQPGEVVVLALPYGAQSQVVEALGPRLAGKAVVDIANPLNTSYNGLATAPGTSSAEEVAQAAPVGTKVVKAFNTTFADALIRGAADGEQLDVLIAGDDSEAKAKVARLVRDAGLRPIDAGPLERARQLEGVGLLHITLQPELGNTWMSSVKFLN
jgi:NADPH-dependent F420 reductase